MSDFISQTLQELFNAAKDRGVDFLRLKALATGIRVIRGIRFLLLLNYIIIIMCSLCTLSFFYGLYLIAVAFSGNGPHYINWPAGLCGAIFLLSTGTLYLTLREKTWLKVFRIEEIVNEAIGGGEEHRSASPSVDYEEIAHIVEKVLDAKLKERDQHRAKKKKSH